MEGGQSERVPPATLGYERLALLFEDRVQQLDENSAVIAWFQKAVPTAESGGLVWPVFGSQTLSFSEYYFLCQI